MALIERTIAGLDRWLDSMRVDWPVNGYGGPVVHWWNQSIVFTGAGFDWRYEGIVCGYLNLWTKTGDCQWLEKALQAGEDLVDAQLPSGNYPNSQFEMNPGTGGTPHEAACSLALLQLADAVRDSLPDRAESFLTCAKRNLVNFHMAELWISDKRALRDRPGTDSFVPNKAATFGEAMLLLGDHLHQPIWLDEIAVPIAERILALQDNESESPTFGGIAQLELRGKIVHSYFPIYVARCIPFLLAVGKRTDDVRFREGATRAGTFLRSQIKEDGSSAQVLYANGQRNDHPCWIAGAGDIARGLTLALPDDHESANRVADWILSGVLPNGAIAAASGFGSLGGWLGRRDRAFDTFPVVGWCDKAFRFLTEMLPNRLPTGVESEQGSELLLVGVGDGA